LGEADFCAFRTISERRIDAGLPQIGRFEHVRVRRENQGQHRHLLSDLIAGSTFGNRPIAVKVSAVGDSCPAAVKVGLGSTRAEPVVMRTAEIDLKQLPAITNQSGWMPSNQGRAWSRSRLMTLPGVMLHRIKVWLNVRRCFMLDAGISHINSPLHQDLGCCTRP
jgi:hypothetical protein